MKNCGLQTPSVWKTLKFVVWERVNSLLNDNILDWSILKAFADDDIQDAPCLSLIEYRILWEKKKMVVTSIFSSSHNDFKSPFHQSCFQLVFVEPACGKRNIAVPTTVQCMCVHTSVCS